jgi:hypothetical protein
VASTFRVELQLVAECSLIQPDATCRVAHYQRMVRHFLGDHGASADEGVTTDVVPTNDGGIRPDGSALASPMSAGIPHAGSPRCAD